MSTADLRSFQAIAGISEATHEPFVLTRAEGDDVALVGQLDPAQARELAHNILEASEAAIHDAALFRFLTDNGSEPDDAARLIGALRNYRQDIDPSAFEDEEGPG